MIDKLIKRTKDGTLIWKQFKNGCSSTYKKDEITFYFTEINSTFSVKAYSKGSTIVISDCASHCLILKDCIKLARKEATKKFKEEQEKRIEDANKKLLEGVENLLG